MWSPGQECVVHLHLMLPVSKNRKSDVNKNLPSPLEGTVKHIHQLILEGYQGAFTMAS